MRRREFLIGTGAVTVLAASTRLWAQGASAKLARVGVSSQNFDAIIKVGVGPAPNPARTLDFLDFPQMIADRLGVHNLELQHSHFVSTEDAYLKDVRDRVAKAKSKIVQINTDFQGSNVSAGGFSARAQGIDLAKVWIDHAEALGCPRLMITPGNLAETTRETTVEALKILADYAKTHHVTMAIENRVPMAAPPPSPPAPPAAAGSVGAAPGRRGGGGGGGGQAQAAASFPGWQTVVDVIKAGGIAAVPDSAGFSTDAERAAGLKALYALSDGNSHVHAASLAAAIKIAKDAGYKGIYSIVTDSNGSDPYAATKTVLDELVKLI